LAYLIPLDVDVTRNITAKICEVCSEFNIFCTLVTMATATILNIFNPPKAATHYGGYYLEEGDKPKKNQNWLDKLCRSCHGNKKVWI
jgi:hypothetical protein